jgi:hypothetical protein
VTRIDKQVREEAAFICAVRASNPDIDTSDIVEMWSEDARDDDGALVLAFDAWDAATTQDMRTNREHWAAAESMLRTGWTP